MRSFSFIALLICSFTAFSQECKNTLSGTVIDQHDGSPLVGATLIVAGTEQAVLTDFNGTFNIPNLCNQTYAIQVSHPFCLTKGFSVKVSGNTTKTFRLEHHLQELNEITLKGKAYKSSTKTLKEHTLSKSDIDRFSNRSLGDALNSLSGVSSLNTGNTVVKPVIHGLHSSRVLIINHGVRMEDQEWGAEHAPNIDINASGRINLIKGASALQYGGDAIGGVIVVEPLKAPVKDSLYGKTLMSFSSNGRGSSVSSRLIKTYKNGWYGTAQGTLKRFGDFHAPNYILSNTGVFERSASLSIGLNRFNYGLEAYYSYFNNEIGILRASHLGGAEDQLRAINSHEPLIINDFTYSIDEPKQNVTHHLARIKAFKNFSDFGKLSLQYDFQQNQRLEFDIRRGNDRNNAALNLKLTTHNTKLDLESDLTEAITLKTGITASYQENYANPNTGVRRLIPDYKAYQFGGYAAAIYEWTPNLITEAGIRFDYRHIDAFKFYRTSFWKSRDYDQRYRNIVVKEFDNQILTNPQLNYKNVSASLGVSYNLGAHSEILFNYSMASRAPNPSELFSEGLHHSASRIELGDLGFVSEISNKLNLTYTYNTDKLSVSVNPFYNNITNFIRIEPTGVQQSLRGNFQVWEYLQADAYLLGFDVDAVYNFTNNWRFTHQFSFLKGYESDTKEPLISLPPISTTNSIAYTNPTLNNLYLSLESAYVFRQNEYPDTNFEVFIPQTETYETIDVSTPPNSYLLFNFYSNMDLKINQKSTLTIGINVENVFNKSYRNYLNRLRYYADDLGRNILLTLKINY